MTNGTLVASPGAGQSIEAAAAGPGVTGRVRDSAGLTVAQRRANLAGTVTARAARVPRGALLVVVDDVVTSGATLTAAAAALGGTGGAGAGPVLAAVVAATPRRPAARAAPAAVPTAVPTAVSPPSVGRRRAADAGVGPRRLDRLSGPPGSD